MTSGLLFAAVAVVDGRATLLSATIVASITIHSLPMILLRQTSSHTNVNANSNVARSTARSTFNQTVLGIEAKA